MAIIRQVISFYRRIGEKNSSIKWGGDVEKGIREMTRGGDILVINIYSKGKYPANALSNFAPNSFDFDGFTNIPCMEAFLQSLKFEDASEQQRILCMNAKEAKAAGGAQKWKKYLYWKGRKIDRFSKEYSLLIENAYNSLLMNPDFKQALVDSGRNILLHTIGKTLRKNTILTWWEFTGILYKLRKKISF